MKNKLLNQIKAMCQAEIDDNKSVNSSTLSQFKKTNMTSFALSDYNK